jgi:riboflavin synthase
VEKGSICVNGISLTVVKSGKSNFSVAIIPHTYAFTNIKNIQKGSVVNIEFDILGKYFAKMRQNSASF